MYRHFISTLGNDSKETNAQFSGKVTTEKSQQIPQYSQDFKLSQGGRVKCLQNWREKTIFGSASGTTGLYLPTVRILVETLHFVMHCCKCNRSWVWFIAHIYCFTGQGKTFIHSLHQEGKQKNVFWKQSFKWNVNKTVFLQHVNDHTNTVGTTYQVLPSKNSLNVLLCTKTPLASDSNRKACRWYYLIKPVTYGEVNVHIATWHWTMKHTHFKTCFTGPF